MSGKVRLDKDHVKDRSGQSRVEPRSHQVRSSEDQDRPSQIISAQVRSGQGQLKVG